MFDTNEIYNAICHPGIERANLHHIIRRPSLLITSKPELDYSKFLSVPAREMFACLESLYSEGVETFDAATIRNEAQNHSEFVFLNKEDGFQYIKAVFDTQVHDDAFDKHYKELLERSRKARLAFVAEDLIHDILDNASSIKGKKSFEDLISKYERDVFNLATNARTENAPISFADIVDTYVEDLGKEVLESLGPRSGFRCLDALLNGFQPGELYILAARYKVGKSMLLMEWAKHLAFFEKVPVLILDTEMSTKSQMSRLYSKLTQIPEIELKRRSYERTPANLEAIELARQIIKGGNLQHKYFPRFSSEALRFEIRKFHKQFGFGVVIFDYIKLPDAGVASLKDANETQQIGYLTTELKNTCGELEIPGIAAVQFNRQAVGKKDPSSSDISASDRVAMFGSVVMALTHLSLNERVFLRGIYGEECDINSKLYILDARNVSSFSDAIYLSSDFERVTFSESIHQPGLDGVIDETTAVAS